MRLRTSVQSRHIIQAQLAQFDGIRVAVTIAVLLTFVLIAAQGEANRQIAAIPPLGRATSARHTNPSVPSEALESRHGIANPSSSPLHRVYPD